MSESPRSPRSQGAGPPLSKEVIAPRHGRWRYLPKTILDCKLLGAIALASAALAAVIYCLLLVAAPPEPVPVPFTFPPDASWITTQETQQSTGCFRLDFSLAGKVVNAWIALATNGGYEVSANGENCAQYFFWNRTRPFQSSLSAEGQKLTPSDGVMEVNLSGAYQWKDHDSAGLPVWIDLTSHLHVGRNALCVEAEKSGTGAAMILCGEVELDTGQKIDLRSGAHWMGEPVPKKIPQNSWTLASTPDADWNHARELPWKRLFWRLVPKGVFEEAFHGQRIRSILPGTITWIRQDFELQSKPLEGFLRVVTDTPYRVWINGCLVGPLTAHSSLLAYGPWLLREFSSSPVDILMDAPAESLGPHQAATSLPGQQAENPSGRDPSGNHVIPDQFSPAGTLNSPATNGNLPSVATAFEGGPSQYADPQNPDRTVPPVLTRDRRKAEFVAYSINPLLRIGTNTVRIGLYNDQPEAADASRQPFLAFDGGAELLGGSFSFSSGETTQGILRGDGDRAERVTKASVDGLIQPIFLPGKEFFGYSYPNRPWVSVASAVFALCALGLLLSASVVPGLPSLLLRGTPGCAILVGWIAAGLLTRSAMSERSEALYWRFPVTPLLLMATGLAGAALALMLTRRSSKKRLGQSNAGELGLPSRKANRNWIWPLLVGMGIALCFVLRAWQIDLQPPDEDEYASIQASLAIAQKGVPEYQQGVWYTRSPAYHYLAGAVSALTGSNIYTLRLLSVLFACATALLIWKIARELTLNRFLSFGALILFAVHPFLIFTGHVARFYQQEQFLHLLLLYFFIRGFISNSGMRDRYLTVLAFLVATLSQEIAILEILPLTICYLLFAKGRRWPDEIRLLVAGGCALALIALDLAFFDVKCLTAVDGVSPQINSTLGWSFESPGNFFALLIGYSRLHLVPSAFLLAGFALAWRSKNARWIFIYTYFFLSVVVLNLLITTTGYRFVYHLLPLWILLSVFGIGECAKFLIQTREWRAQRLTLALGWLAIIIFSWSPWRILTSYDSTLYSDPVRALRYVAGNLRVGDRVAISELYPQAALIETGRSDYDMAVPILYDFALRKKGRLVDRNAAAEVIGNFDELQRAFSKNQRLWIIVDRDKMQGHGSSIQWNFSAGRILLYLQNNAHLVFRSSLWSVYLWDQSAGHYSTFREKPANWFD
jgi:Dolichyl-phosphate-mannose-protein mannosyltransferase